MSTHKLAYKALCALLAFMAALFAPTAHASSYGDVRLAPTQQRTYSFTTPNFTPSTSAGDLIQQAGSGSRKTQILKVYMNYSMYSDTTVHTFEVMKRSSLDSGGTANSVTGTPLDSNDSAATSSCSYFTSVPSAGTDVGRISSLITGVDNGGGGANGTSYGGYNGAVITTPILLFDCDKYGKPITLNSATECAVVKMSGNITPGAAGTPRMSFTFVVREE